MSGMHPSKRRNRPISLATVVLCSVTGLVCFYFGLLVGHSTCSSSSSCNEDTIKQRIKAEVRRVTQQKVQSTGSDVDSRFPPTMASLAAGLARVDRDEFNEHFEIGVPLDPTTDSNKEVLILYNNEHSLPDNAFEAKEASSQTATPQLDVESATSNCDYLNIALVDHSGKRRQCLAFVGQLEAYHWYKWMRLPESGKLDATAPLRYVNRGAQGSGRLSTKPPDDALTKEYWKILAEYLTNLDTILEQLKPLAEKAAVNNTIVVLVCNFGQSELLLNFVCSARRRNLNLSAVLVFATDEETRDLASSLGVTAFYDPILFGAKMPKEAARRYADKYFRVMMLAKVWCVQMPVMLGYNVLFQDVDVVWYKDPLEYFHSPEAGDWDMYFQDDGNHALYYAPYSANTGFYYVRHNEKTKHFFNNFLMAGNLVLSTKSHQVPLIALLNEHASMYGLKIKIFSRDENDFPGGHAFNRRKDFMRDLFAGAVQPYIFHMSWTLNKDNKLRYMQQMGEWYLQPQCVQKELAAIETKETSMLEACCAAEPLVTCHYRDKPSKIPCRDSPPIDKGRGSFW